MYTLKVWLTSVFLTPLLFSFYISITAESASITERFSDFVSSIPFFGIIVFVGFIASIPNFILFYLFTKKMHQLSYPPRGLKVLVNLVAILLTYFLFLLLEENNDMWLITLAYSFTLTLGIWFFPLGKK